MGNEELVSVSMFVMLMLAVWVGRYIPLPCHCIAQEYLFVRVDGWVGLGWVGKGGYGCEFLRVVDDVYVCVYVDR